MINSHEVEYDHIATMQLEAAIDHFNSGQLTGFICATTLAGAAEEIFGKLLNLINKEHILGTIKKERDEEEVKNLNLVRNAYKHLSHEFCDKEFNPRTEALYLILRTIINFCRLNNVITDKMQKFLEKYEMELMETAE